MLQEKYIIIQRENCAMKLPIFYKLTEFDMVVLWKKLFYRILNIFSLKILGAFFLIHTKTIENSNASSAFERKVFNILTDKCPHIFSLVRQDSSSNLTTQGKIYDIFDYCYVKIK